MFIDVVRKQKYLQKNRIIGQIEELPKDYFEWDEEENILLDSSKCMKSEIDINNYTCCIGWIMMENGRNND